MKIKKNFFLKKKILIYGLGKSGSACFDFLIRNNNLIVFDDNFSIKNKKYNKYFFSPSRIKKTNFDYIFLSPGIDISRCILYKFLKKNKNKIISELDIFHKTYPNLKKITITGTNGKSTTSKLIYDVLKYHKKDVRLAGNIGNPILKEKNIKKNTIFVIEASSYQIDYSKYFETNIALILNISPDHIERHKTFQNYAKVKIKLITKQKKNSIALIEKNSKLITDILRSQKVKSKLKKVDIKEYENFYKKIKNNYFKNLSNIKNLSFVLKLSNILKLDNSKILKVVNSFKGLNYRQQIIYNKKKFLIINDSKSTSFSSTLPLLQSYKNIYWILGGLAKKGDKLNLDKKLFKEINAYIYGTNRFFFSKVLKNKCRSHSSKNLKDVLSKLFSDIKKNKDEKKTILFSPAAASFDQFKNFEERGRYFNQLLKKYINA